MCASALHAVGGIGNGRAFLETLMCYLGQADQFVIVFPFGDHSEALCFVPWHASLPSSLNGEPTRTSNMAGFEVRGLGFKVHFKELCILLLQSSCEPEMFFIYLAF